MTDAPPLPYDECLVRARSSFVRRGLVANYDLSYEHLEDLTYDKDDTVRLAIAKKHPQMHWEDTVSARYLYEYASDLLARRTMGYLQSEVDALAENWAGSVRDLREALDLVRR